MAIRRKLFLVLVAGIAVFGGAGLWLLDNDLDRLRVRFAGRLMEAAFATSAARPGNEGKGTPIGAAAVLDLQAETALMGSIKYTQAAVLGLMLTMAVLAGRCVGARSVSRSVEHILNKFKARTGDGGDLAANLPEVSGDALSSLALWCDHLLEKLSWLVRLNWAVLDVVPDPFFVVDKNMRVMLANTAMARLAGQPLDAIGGMRCADIFNSDACCTSRCPVDAGKSCSVVVGDPQGISCEKDGAKRFYKTTVQALVDAQGTELVWLNLAQDITVAQDRENEQRKHLRHVRDVNTVLTDVSREINEAISAIFGKVDEVNDGASLQQRRVEETLTAMNQMTVSAYAVADNAQAASRQAREARESAQAGETVVRQAIEAIQAVKSQTEILRENMTRLGRRAQDIGRILSVISDIADQTNLLALNAAIEAARAGEGGRGFAVVADEVRKLAEKTMLATGEVNQAIASIQEETHKNLGITEQAASVVDAAAALSEHSGETLDHIVGLISQTAGQVETIATAAKQQSAVSENISHALHDVNAVSLSTAKGMDDSSQALMELSALAGRLRTEVLSAGS
jgi:PAS domain S-box-containing protein